MIKESKDHNSSDNQKRIIYIFPGQGCQYKGMGSDIIKEFKAAKDVYDKASEALGYDMIELCINDPENKLDKTEFTQPALLTHEIACMESLLSQVNNKEALVPHLALGHSLGEYAALVATNTISFEDAIRLVKERAEIMSKYATGSMVATNLSIDQAKHFAASMFLSIAAHNAENQTVLAGDDKYVDQFISSFSSNKRVRAVKLNTEGAFHSYIMASAAEEFRKQLKNTNFSIRQLNNSSLPSIIANHTADLHPYLESYDEAIDSIRSTLYFQLFNPVLWYDSMKKAVDQEPIVFIEFGGGIGKESGPENKRANLISMNKKTIMSQKREIEYFSSINNETIFSTAEKLNNI